MGIQKLSTLPGASKGQYAFNAAVVSAATVTPYSYADGGKTYACYVFTGSGTITFSVSGIIQTLIVGGGGSGGSRSNGYCGGGGAGGSGVVVLRHPSTFRQAATTGSPTITQVNGYIVYTFTGTGTITF